MEVMTNILALVIGVMFSPGLPEGTIEIGQTTCQDAQVILQKHHLRLRDTEFLDLSIAAEMATLQDEGPRQEIVAVQTLAFERDSSGWGRDSKYGKKKSHHKSPPNTQAGLLLCGWFLETDGDPDPNPVPF